MASPRHGTETMYKKRGCRCDDCVQATRAADRRRRALARQRPTPDYVHGRISGYTYWGCKCGLCTAAYRKAQAPRAAEYRRVNREKIRERQREYRRRKREEAAAAEAARRARLLKRGA